MTQIFANLPAGEPGCLAPPKGAAADDQHLVDVPVIGTPEPAGVPAGGLRAVCAGLLTGSRAELRNRIRVLQLLLTIGALAFIRPQYQEWSQWVCLIVLVHSFVVSFVLLWDKRCCGTIVRSLLPLLDWRALELRYTATVALLLYALFFGQLFAHRGYRSDVWCNWLSTVLSLLTGLAYGCETWLQLRNLYDGRRSMNN